jgi:hypothetical protein
MSEFCFLVESQLFHFRQNLGSIRVNSLRIGGRVSTGTLIFRSVEDSQQGFKQLFLPRAALRCE